MTTRSEDKSTHWFLDEAGDAVFFGKGRVPVIGKPGVSLAFSLGKAEFLEELEPLRERIRLMQREVEEHPEWGAKPSVLKKRAAGGFYFHATDDFPEVRDRMFDFIASVNCRFEMIVARKDPEIFQRKHNGKDSAFYADLLGHLLKRSLDHDGRLVLNIAALGNTTRQHHLDDALERAKRRFRGASGELRAQVSFNVQPSSRDPLLGVTDYLCWAVHRVFERGDLSAYERVKSKVTLVIDHFDKANYEDYRNYYWHPRRLLGAGNKISPPSP